MNKIKRDTTTDLFRNVLAKVKENGDYANAEKIIDYALPASTETILSNYRFDFIAAVQRGGSEGIFVDCYLEGEFDDSKKTRCSVGCIKTLGENLEASKIMGELAGILSYYSYNYVKENIDRYEPEKDKKI